jgi:hypothetical protein
MTAVGLIYAITGWGDFYFWAYIAGVPLGIVSMIAAALINRARFGRSGIT